MVAELYWRLEELTYDECETFIPLLDGDIVFCPSVCDGDSSGRKVRIVGRLLGVDTPEMTGSSAHEKSLARKAKQRLEDVVMGEFVTIRNSHIEKYGRSVSDLQVGNIESVADYMLTDPTLCNPYEGGTKQKWD